MDYNETLLSLTTVDKTNNEEIENFDGRLQHILLKILPTLPEHDKEFITDDIHYENGSDIRYQYLRAVVRVLQTIKTSNVSNEESLLSIKQFHTLRVAIELVTAIGIIPALLPGVGNNMVKLCPRASEICKENVTDLQKYKRLTFTVHSLMELSNDIMFHSAVLVQIGPLLAALLQLSHAPLMKPLEESTSAENTSENEFKMTTDLYNKLKKDQDLFTGLMQQLLNSCPMSMSMKEFMVILGMKGAPKWLQRETRKYLIHQLMQPNGIVSLATAVCEDVLDFGEHWNKLDTVSRLIAATHGSDPDHYYQAICPQILNLLTTKQVKYSSTIANCCIIALYEHNPDVCIKNIMEVICDSLLVNPINKQDIIKNEDEVERCIEILMNCFVTVEAKFKQLPCELLMKVAVPLFCLYNNVRQSACPLKSKIKQLVLRLLHEESSRNSVYAELLGHSSTGDFGQRLASRFGPTGRVEIIGIDATLNYEEFADSLLDLTSATNVLSTELFSYLLKFLSNSMKLEKEGENLLETEDDMMERIGKQLAAVKLLSNLANVSVVQEAQIENPRPILSFIKSLYNNYVKKGQNSSDEGDCEILYVSLMLIKMILSVRRKPLNWAEFNDFAIFLKDSCTLSNVPKQLLLLMRELIELIETQGRLKQKHYRDLSADNKTSSMFNNALKDVTDPLLPVRAHGLITFTKLIENKDPCATARKAIILQLFKENLKNEDSFIYLAAINGLCTLATSYPQVVIETLVQEYVDMANRVATGEITTETRIKLGEILVKVTRSLGEMASAYKNILVNGFLCATRDSDSLVRASSLSCLGELCKVLGFRLGDILIEVIYCVSCIIKTDKVPECRRAAVMVVTLLLRGLGKDTLTNLGKDLVELYRGLKHLRNNSEDPVLRLHAQLALEELDDIVRDFLFTPPKLEKRMFLLDVS
ncbi:transport and Golgi organization protein 6 homolog isoform X1 [Hylaeus anthracinus]|uniref:transport and Golgi organization protein 6 homolog isoform X1 n=1 Tax=Hylaeus anthracinus TaxID=313031 RepID=UPI0023BA033B|nr:transport and Golgi organization protein 6 homolog isoform X1 [Hylaeus anthracinus]